LKKKTPRNTKKTSSNSTLPTVEELQKYLQDSENAQHKRDIAQAFGVKGQDRTQLRKLLRQMADDGIVAKTPSKTYATPDRLPDTAMVEVTGLNDDGEMMARPVEWASTAPLPIIYVSGARLSKGDVVLAKMKKTGENHYDARVLKIKQAAPDTETVTGVFKSYKGGGYVTPTNKKDREEYFVPAEFTMGASDGDLVSIERIPSSAKMPRSKNPSRVVERIGDRDDPRLISLIAIHSHGIPTQFSRAAMEDAEKLSEPDLSDGREDMRDIPLVTIDGADARDFDDAVFAEPDAENEGGWHIVVAIADVSYYVRTGTALDDDAVKRGNSTYFADRVVPMLPERLSNDLCSLRPKVNRACLAVHMTIDRDGNLAKFRFARGLMRSAARLTYEQVEEAHKGSPDDDTAPLIDIVIKPLYKAYNVMKRARQLRGALELDLPERKAIIKDGIVTAIVPRQRLESHQLIEEFMILANVAAALELERKKSPCIYRVHDQPSYDRLEATRDFLKEMGYSLPKSDELHPKNINNLLKLSTERGEAGLVHTMLLRTQSQAIYSPDNNGHFGLALEKYAHFTSPIRRYADLIVHRSLVSANKLGPGGLSDREREELFDISEHISQTERRSMLAERDVMDRFTAQYLSSQIGAEFKGRVSGVQNFGLFVTLDESGADGIVPMRQLPRDYYVYDENRHSLTGKEFGRSYRLSDPVIVRLLEADAMRGSTVFEMVDGSSGDTRPRKDRRAFGKGKKSSSHGRDKGGKPGGSKDHKHRGQRRRK
jgi:ribonuclease R